MTDEAFAFRETEKERKRLARGAFSKRSGAKSKACKMPSDNLTEGEKRKLNGKELTWNLKKPMKWEEFKSMPPDLQEKYEQRLVREYGARACDMAAMFGITSNSLSKYNNKHGIKAGFKIGIKKETELWRAFITSGEQKQTEVSVQAEEQKEAQEESCSVKQEEILSLTNGEVYMRGYPEAIFEKMMQLLGERKRYVIRIGFFEA